MQIIRNSIETAPGPSDWFTGAVYIDAVATPSDASRLSASSVHFSPGVGRACVRSTPSRVRRPIARQRGIGAALPLTVTGSSSS
jgi:hypothetical protein